MSTSLELTLYNVYEAKKFAESVGSVGLRTHISIISEDGSSQLTSVNVDRQLEACYSKYGPKPLPEDLKFKGEYYYKSSPGETA